MSLAIVRRTLSQCAATVLSVLEEIDENGATVSRRYQLARDGRSLGPPLLDPVAAEQAFLREMKAP